MAFKINGSDVINASRQFTSAVNVSVVDSIVIANNDTLDAVSGSAAGYTFSDGTVVIGEDGLGLNDVTLQDAFIAVTGPPVFQGTFSGYTSSSYIGGTSTDTIDKFSFIADANATDVGDLTQARWQISGQSSAYSGYSSGGTLAPAGGIVDTIDKFPFATDANATDVGNLVRNTYQSAGQSNTPIAGYATDSSNIQKFPFATDANATDVGVLTLTRSRTTGQSSTVNGYTSGGEPFNKTNVIDKFPFATDANATDVGDLTQAKDFVTGQSSSESGYTSGGRDNLPGVGSNIIDKFPFATDANATDVGDLVAGKYAGAGQSSNQSGYFTGGWPGNNDISKFSFSSDANATFVGDLTQATTIGSAGQQV